MNTLHNYQNKDCYIDCAKLVRFGEGYKNKAFSIHEFPIQKNRKQFEC